MRIGIFTDSYPPYINGVATSIAMLEKALKKRGHQVFVVTVNPDMMTCEEKKRMNEYHAMVYDLIAPNLTADEAAWLKNATRAI